MRTKVPIEDGQTIFGYTDEKTYNKTSIAAKLLTKGQLEQVLRDYLMQGKPVQANLPPEFFIYYTEWRHQFPEDLFARLMYG